MGFFTQHISRTRFDGYSSQPQTTKDKIKTLDNVTKIFEYSLSYSNGGSNFMIRNKEGVICNLRIFDDSKMELFKTSEQMRKAMYEEIGTRPKLYDWEKAIQLTIDILTAPYDIYLDDSFEITGQSHLSKKIDIFEHVDRKYLIYADRFDSIKTTAALLGYEIASCFYYDLNYKTIMSKVRFMSTSKDIVLITYGDKLVILKSLKPQMEKKITNSQCSNWEKGLDIIGKLL